MRYDAVYDKGRASWVADSGKAVVAKAVEHAEGMGDWELMAAMLGIRGGRTGADLADKVLEAVDVDRWDADVLRNCGMTDQKIAALLAAKEFFERRTRLRGYYDTITSPGDIYREVRHYASRMQEQFIVLVLNGAHEVLDTVMVSMGMVNKTLVHPREVFAPAIEKRATAIAIAHNHPSGNLDPSEDDINSTRRIKVAGDIVGIKLIDHLVFTQKGYYSFLEHGLLDRC